MKFLFQALKNYMVKNEEWEISPRSSRLTLHEKYAAGELFRVGDVVESLTSGLRGKVHRCGANHLICVTENGIMFKNFIHDVSIV